MWQTPSTSIDTSGPRRLLCLGFIEHDLEHLIKVAQAAQQTLALEPAFLSIAPAEMGQNARAFVRRNGFSALELTTQASEAQGVHNAVERSWSLRQANKRLARELLAETRPTVVVATVNAASNFFLAEVTKAGIPTIFLQLFFWSDRAFYRAWRQDDLRFTEQSLTRVQRLRRRLARWVAAVCGVGYRIVWDQPVSKIAVQGPAMRRLLVSQGVPASRVVATGSPASDALWRLRSPDAGRRARVTSQLGLSSDARYFLHCRAHEARLYGLSQLDREQSQAQIIRALQDADSNAAIVVKLHPREGQAEEQLIRSIDSRVIIAQGHDVTDELIAESQVTVATISTTLLTAVAMDRPSISAFFWPGLDYWRRAQDWPGVERVNTGGQLTEAVRRYLGDPAYAAAWRTKREALAQDQMLLDGKGTARLVELVQRLVERRRVDPDAAPLAHISND